ncbi:hypothetical protein MJH12_09195, partial [bacterium]|nr:hypothetical protein [bacterium]
LSLLGCDQLETLKSKTLDSLSLSPTEVARIKNKPSVLEKKGISAKEAFLDKRRLLDYGRAEFALEVAKVLIEGKLVEKDVKAGITYLISSMFQDDQSQEYLFNLWLKENTQEQYAFMFEVLNKDLYVHKNNVHRLRLLASMHEKGFATKVDPGRAYYYYKLASEMGDQKSQQWMDSYGENEEKELVVQEKLRVQRESEDFDKKEALELKAQQEAHVLQKIKDIEDDRIKQEKLEEGIRLEKERLEDLELDKVRLAQEEIDKKKNKLRIQAIENREAKEFAAQREKEKQEEFQERLNDPEEVFSMDELLILEKDMAFDLLEKKYLKLVLQNSFKVQEYLGAYYYKRERYIDAVTFYFLASKSPSNDFGGLLEEIISKMSREEFEQAKKRVQEWLDKIKAKEVVPSEESMSAGENSTSEAHVPSEGNSGVEDKAKEIAEEKE